LNILLQPVAAVVEDQMGLLVLEALGVYLQIPLAVQQTVTPLLLALEALG
tara:strand:- start:214 stop:363 length:150 start_codon:yes stop_codon:yes gene_type:complete